MTGIRNILKLVITISLVFELAVAQTAPVSDPCTTYRPFPDSEHRGTNYTLSDGQSSIDDNELTEGWYGDTRYTLVDESPGFYKCGGWYPMYIQGPTISSTVTVCVQTISEPCKYPFEIERRTCSGYDVYYLPQAPVHRAVYCLSASPGAPPEFIVTSTVNFGLLHKPSSSELLSFCNFTRSSENLFYKTIWYVEGAPIYTFKPLEWSSDDTDYIDSRKLTEQLLQENGIEKAGFYLQCGVQAMYGLGKTTSSGELSKAKFVGVKIVQNRSRPLKEGERRTIGLELTVPFGCGTAIRDKGLLCEFDINVQRVEKPGNNALASVIENSCSVDPIRSTNGRTSVSVVGKITPLYKEESATTHLKLKTPSRSIQFSSFWTDYEIGLVTIQLVKNTTLFQSKSCSSANDPRIRTFDGTRFYLDHADVYTLYTDFNNIEVQIQTEDCGRERRRHGPFCTCGVVVRAGRTVFEISHCESLTWHIGFTACGDDGDVLQVRRQWGAYKIHLPTGNTVTVNIHNSEKMHFLNVDVMSSVNDFGKSRGMCGKLSATTGDDRVKKDGSSTTSDEDFAESWRVNEENNLFSPDVIRDGLSHYKPLLHYCTCRR
ncbi:uncharacterized protein LOC124267463 [Haliotis rubra]|uniref:uncharacterized protein LOC124267463 n=1 Tax=Haliotis rubra TaxID=36100 RepID=UPI001EE55F5E|nr:uncharacterized protein LOC124267463 [Haliotis rubra]